jgi:hypothetical protein
MVDGKIIQRATDRNDFGGKGTGILFYAQQGNIKISEISVTEWSGAVENQADKAQKAKENDSILFVNKDTVTGKLKSIKDGKIIFETPFAPLTIPVDRISSITFGEAGYEKPRRNNGDVEVYFANNSGKLTMQLESLSKNKISGISENFDKANFDVVAFEKIVFNIYKEKKKKSEEDDW